MLLLLRILVLFCSIPQLVLTSNDQHITITGDDGTIFEQNQHDPSKIHIHAKTNDLHPHDVTIRVHNQNKNQLFPDQYTQQTNRAPANVFMQTLPIRSQSHTCQEYIDNMVSAQRERNDMALHLSSLQLKIKQLEHANHLLHKQQYSHQQNLRKRTIESPIIISQDKTNTISPDEHTDITENTPRQHAKESANVEDDSTDKEISEEKMKDTIVAKGQGKNTFQWKKNKWSILIFALLFLIPIIVGIIFFCISKNTNDIPDQNTAFIVDEPVKKNSVQKELPFVLNEPQNVNHYSRQSTSADIQRLSQNLDGYFQNSNVSTKPVISESKNNMEEHNDTKPVISNSSTDNVKRQSLVEQQMSSSEDDAM